MDVVTLGMFIIDEIHFKPPRKPELDIIGGAGSWAVIGARLFRPIGSTKRIGWTVHKGYDFPASVEEEIVSYGTTCNFIDTPNRLTTRGWNKYGDDEERAFRYLTEKLRVDETQLTPELLKSKTFHLICTPARCINLVEGILARRKEIQADDNDKLPRPKFIWEPVPDSMGPDELDNLFKALKYVDVVSPNHQELAALFRTASSDDAVHTTMEDQCFELLEKGFGTQPGAVVVRCGERGCYIATANGSSTMPAYYRDIEAAKWVVDPTGAGNAFLGALCIGLLGKPPPGKTAIENGAAFGSVAASFAVEQVGLPRLNFVTGDLRESWNHDSVNDRLQKFWGAQGVSIEPRET